MRRFGKSAIQRTLIEQLLDNGKTVVVVGPAGAVKKKRIGHLTSHEVLKSTLAHTKVIFDDIDEINEINEIQEQHLVKDSPGPASSN